MTTGEVIRVKKKYYWRHVRMRAEQRRWETDVAVIRFFAPNGQSITFTSICLDAYTPGNHVQVRYLPERPAVAELPLASIFLGHKPTYFDRMIAGGVIFPFGGYLLLMVLPQMLPTIWQALTTLLSP
jgi:hypothetical protein